MTTAPDSNVRAARRAAAGAARGTGGSGLARLLLKILATVTGSLHKLDRKLLLLLAVSPMSACIIPIAPEFQDPEGAPNIAPRIVDSNPFNGQRVVASGGTAKFSISVLDPNGGDTLYFRWLVEFPPFTVGSTHVLFADNPLLLPRTNGAPAPRPVDETFDCNDINNDLTTHLITAVVSDRPFQAVFGMPLNVEDDGLIDTATWTLALTCQTQTQP